MRYIIILLILPFMAFSDSPKSLMLKGNEAFEAGKSAEAIENYDNALKILPNNPYLTYNKGIAAYADKNYEIALGHFREAHKLTLEAPKRDLAFESGCLASAGDALFQQAKAISENKENQMQNLDTALQMSSEAAANYESAIKVYPKNKTAESAIKQAKLLNKKLLTIKKQQEKQQDQNKQDQNKQDQNKQKSEAKRS